MVPNEKNYDLNSVQSEHLPSQLGKSTVINLLVNSHIGSSNESDQ